MLKKITLNTPIGSLSFSAKAAKGNLDNFEIKTCEIQPILPEGMSVEVCTAVLLRGTSVIDIENIVYSCTWDSLKEKGYGTSGEALDAWEWEHKGKLVMVGTEDSEWLDARLKLNKEFNPSNYPISMTENRIIIKIEEFRANKELSLHFVVAWNSLPEKKECSCWFALDFPHERILQSCK